MPQCSVDECEMGAVRVGMCHKHYSRVRRYGDPSITKSRPNTPGRTPAARAAYIKQYKLIKGCADCGYRGHHAALDFDHRPGTIKVRDIRKGSSLGWDAMLEEIAKCDVVCANCHRVRTYVRYGEMKKGGDEDG